MNASKSGPASGTVGSRATFSWSGATPNSNFWFLYSFTNSGFVYAGHQFDLGAPVTIFTSGVNSGAGTGSLLSPPLPAGLLGRVLYLEVAAMASPGVFEDSNFLVFTIQ